LLPGFCDGSSEDSSTGHDDLCYYSMRLYVELAAPNTQIVHPLMVENVGIEKIPYLDEVPSDHNLWDQDLSLMEKKTGIKVL
jgi:hypothetical protein